MLPHCDKKADLFILILFYAKTLSPTNYVCILIIFATYIVMSSLIAAWIIFADNNNKCRKLLYRTQVIQRRLQ